MWRDVTNRITGKRICQLSLREKVKDVIDLVIEWDTGKSKLKA